MLTYKNGSDTAVIVVHEIYGLNDHIRDVCKFVSELGYDVYAPNLLVRDSFGYEQESTAYQYFFETIGLTNAVEEVKKLILAIRLRYKRVYVIGFSVGATIAWLCSGLEGLCDKVVGFYGSRIRDYVVVSPKCPVLLIFPDQEQSFSVEALILQLNTIERVETLVLPGQHGFANRFAKYYCKASAVTAQNRVVKFLN